MKNTFKKFTAVIFILSSLVVAGCGGSSMTPEEEDAYATELNNKSLSGQELTQKEKDFLSDLNKREMEELRK